MLIFEKGGGIRDKLHRQARFELMKPTHFVMVLALLLGFPLFQMDQVIDTEWLVCENFLAVKFEGSDFSADKTCDFYPEPSLPLLDPISFISQLRNPLYILYASSKGIFPFWRPPPFLFSSSFKKTEQHRIF